MVMMSAEDHSRNRIMREGRAILRYCPTYWKLYSLFHLMAKAGAALFSCAFIM